MKQKLVKILKNVFLLILFTTFLFAGDVQDDLTDTSLQNTYGIKDGGVISASNLRTLFMKLASGAWSTNGTSIYYNKGNVGIGTSNPIYPLDINHNAPWGYAIKLNAPENNDNLIAFFKNNNENKKWVIGLDNGNDAGPYDFAIWTNNNNLGYVMTMKENGNVGIGTAYPSGKLEVYANTSLVENNIRFTTSTPDSSTSNVDLQVNNTICTWGGIKFLNPSYNVTNIEFSNWNGSERVVRMGIYGINGNIGIGTTDPKTKLDINGTLYLRKNDNGNEGGEVQFEGAGAYPLWYQDVYLDRMRFYVSGNASGDNLVLYRNGNVGIGTSNNITDEKLVVYGNIKATGTITPSDFRYKKNINTLENALEKVLSLHGVSFEWKTEEYQDKHFTQGKNMGFIAQEAEKVVPEVVQTGKDGYKSMAYANLTALLVEAFKELNGKFEKTVRENEILKSKLYSMSMEIKELKIQNEELIKRLNAYETKMEKIDTLLMKK